MDYKETFYTLVQYKCKRCGFTLEHRYKSPGDHGGGMMMCTCGAFGLDPHPLWPRVAWRNGADPHVDIGKIAFILRISWLNRMAQAIDSPLIEYEDKYILVDIF